MNQIFSFLRFVKYLAYQYRMRSKIFLLTVGGAFIAMLFVFFMITKGQRSNNWEQMFWLFGVLGAVLYIGNSFPDFRKKETTVNFLMIPASVFEKFVFEFINRIVLFTIMYPVMFYFASHLSVYISGFIFPDRDISQFSFDILFDSNVPEAVKLYFIPAVYLFIISAFFAGAVIFRRHPLIKTLVITGVFILSVFGYFRFIFQETHLGYGLDYFFNEKINNGTNILLEFLSAILVLSSITVLFYVYFKLKEKEV